MTGFTSSKEAAPRTFTPSMNMVGVLLDPVGHAQRSTFQHRLPVLLGTRGNWRRYRCPGPAHLRNLSGYRWRRPHRLSQPGFRREYGDRARRTLARRHTPRPWPRPATRRPGRRSDSRLSSPSRHLYTLLRSGAPSRGPNYDSEVTESLRIRRWSRGASDEPRMFQACSGCLVGTGVEVAAGFGSCVGVAEASIEEQAATMIASSNNSSGAGANRRSVKGMRRTLEEC